MSRSGFLIVTGKDGLQGIIETARADTLPPVVTVQLDSGQHQQMPLAAPTGEQCQQVVMRLSSGEQILIPSEALELQPDHSYYVAYGRAELENQFSIGLYHEGDKLIVPVILEDLTVRTQKIETGKVRIRKIVHEREEIIDDALLEEAVDVVRVPIDRPVDGPVADRFEGDTHIIAILEEVFVVEKRLIFKEELHITRRQSHVHKPQRVILRSEEAIVERLNLMERVHLTKRLNLTEPGEELLPD